MCSTLIKLSHKTDLTFERFRRFVSKFKNYSNQFRKVTKLSWWRSEWKTPFLLMALML